MLLARSYNQLRARNPEIKIQIRFQLISIQIIVITNDFLCSTKILFFCKNIKVENYAKNIPKKKSRRFEKNPNWVIE